MFLVSRPRLMIFVGFLCVMAGCILPFLMVMKVLESTFFLNFFAYAVSLIGVFLGIIGTAMYVNTNKKEDR